MKLFPMRLLPLTILALLMFPPATPAAEISRIEINQAIGIQKNNALKFVAGKNTVVRAFLASAEAIDPGRTSAKVIRDGQTVATLAPAGDGSSAAVVDFLCPNREACGDWAAGSYVFEVAVNGATSSTAGTTYDFVERAALRMLAVPVKANYGGVVVSVTDERWKKFADYVRKTYPLAPDKFVWEIRDDFDASDKSFDLETDDGRRNLWEALAKLIPPQCADNPSTDGCFHQVFGFIMDRPNGYPNGTLQGYTYGKPANIGVVRDEDAEATVAHEIGHTFGLGDTYDGGSFHCPVNPAPDSFKGKDFNDATMPVSCATGRQALEGVGGTLIPASHNPYEVGGRGALGDMAEYMGSGGKQAQFWTTQDAWDHLFDKFAPAAKPTAMRTATATARYIQCFGTIRQNAVSSADVQMDPCWTYDDDAGAIPNSTGKYMMAAASAAGVRLASAALNPDFDPVPPKGTEPVVLAIASFGEEMPMPAGTAKLQIIRDDIVVREIPVSANAPVVTSVAPGLSGTVSGLVSISWLASDADGDPLSFEVIYNPDVTREDSEWEILVRDVTSRSLAIDFGDMPGGPHAKLAVIASDGINSGQAESGEFIVPAQAPEVFIGELQSSFFRRGSEIILDAEVLDLQDDWISESQLVWTSSLSGRIGTGASLVVDNLPVGKHVLTLTATNSAGVKGSGTVTVYVVDSTRRRGVRK